MKKVNEYTYLGDVISGEGVGASVLARVEKRFDKAMHAVFEIKSIIEDCRKNVVGGFCTGISIWEMAILPYILNSTECWISIPKKAIVKLSKFQDTFYRSILATGQGCPIPSLYWETGGLLMSNRIL